MQRHKKLLFDAKKMISSTGSLIDAYERGGGEKSESF